MVLLIYEQKTLNSLHLNDNQCFKQKKFICFFPKLGKNPNIETHCY